MLQHNDFHMKLPMTTMNTVSAMMMASTRITLSSLDMKSIVPQRNRNTLRHNDFHQQGLVPDVGAVPLGFILS